MPSSYGITSWRLSRDIQRVSVFKPGISRGNAVSGLSISFPPLDPESLGFGLVDSCFGSMVRDELDLILQTRSKLRL